MNKGVIYVVSNDCFKFLPNCYKIGLTINIENRKKDYITTYPSDCVWEYISPEVTYIKIREKLIFKRLNEYRCRVNREFFCCELPTVIETINSILTLTYKDMCEELNIKDYNNEYNKFFKSCLTPTQKGNYDKVDIQTLFLTFKAWCKSKGINKLPSLDEFYEKVDNKYKVKESKEGFDYLEKIIFTL